MEAYKTIHDEVTGTWEIPYKSRYNHSVGVRKTYGTDKIEALHILEKTLNMITAVYSEVKGAIDQFDGKLKGWLGFFDAAIIEPKPFSDEAEFKIIKPAGGGGTDFQIIFEYVHKHMAHKLPASIIILTDGFAPFPKETLAGNIPVLWLLNNDTVEPPWGKVARISV